ncbi:hypothetical protein A2U01_0112968, partial [Trifolium medium]|nr:hypothetical protein [Trifolium medium]
MEQDGGRREWSGNIKAEDKRRGGRQTSRWLREESAGAGGAAGGARA